MWTWQLSLLALVAPLAPPVTAAPKPAIAGAPNLGAQSNQFSTLDSYDTQPYNQRAYDYQYNDVTNNNGLYNNGYYNGGSNYYDPAAYDYSQYNGQTNSYSVKSNEPQKTDSSNDGNYDPKKYGTGYYDAKLYNSGRNDASNYDNGHYDHAKYGTRPVHNAKLAQSSGSGDFRAKIVGSGSRAVGSEPGSVGYFIHGDGKGGFDWGHYGQYGHLGKETNVAAKRSGFVQKDSGFHTKKSSSLKKDSVHKTKGFVKKNSVGKDFSFNTKEVFSKIDVFGPNHQQIFTGGKRVFNDGQRSGPSHITLGDPEPSNERQGSGDGFDSYGFYSDLPNLYLEKSFDGKSSADEAFNQRQTPNNLNFNAKQSVAAAFEPTFPPGPGQIVSDIDDFDKQSTLDIAGSGDSYGYYSQLSNLYGEKPWLASDSAADSDATPAIKDFDAGLSENQLHFDGQQASVVEQLSQDDSPSETGFDSYGYYSNLDNLYNPEKSKGFPVKKKTGTKNLKVTSGLDRTSSFGDFNDGLSENGLDFNSQPTKTGGKFNQKIPANSAAFDSYGFYSDLGNLYREDSSEVLREDPATRRQSHLNAGSASRVGSKSRLDSDRQSKTSQFGDRAKEDSALRSFRRQELDATRSQNEVEFDSYGFYSDPRNLYV